MDQQPQMRWDEATQSVVELAPVTVSRDDYQAKLEAAQIDANNSDGEVRGLEEHKANLETELQTVTDNLNGAVVRQEEAQKALAFQEARIAAYDEVVRLGSSQSVAAQPNADVAAPTDGTEAAPIAGQPTPEDVADALDLDEDSDESEAAESVEQEVPIRRRATV